MDESIEKLEQWSECSARSAIFTEIANSRSNTTESEVHFESLHGVRWLGTRSKWAKACYLSTCSPGGGFAL